MEEALQTYIEKYLEVDNWYPMELEAVEIRHSGSLADLGGDYLTREILDYMKFGVWDNLEIQPDGGGQFLKDVREASRAGELTDVYDGQEREVRKLEEAVEAITACVENQDKMAAEIADALAADHPDEFRRAGRAFRREAERMNKLTDRFEEQADRLERRLEDTRSALADASSDFQENRAQLFEEQMNPYEAYVGENGNRRREIRQQLADSQSNLALLEQTEAMVDAAETAWEMSRQEAELGAEPEAEWDEPELSLDEAAGLWGRYIHGRIRTETGRRDEEKRGFLDQVKALAQNRLLELVLPAEMQVSSGAFPVETFPSRRIDGSSQTAPNPVERALLHEYCGEFFTHALSTEAKPVQYELEYLLQAEGTDRENLEQTLTQLLLIRQGLNLIHILADPEKRGEARGLAAAITGVTGLAPLVEITACFIMGIWASGEAVMDLRTLLAGGRVPLWKAREDWKLSLDGLLAMGKEKSCPEAEKEAKGFSYETYLKLLLFLTAHQDLQMRMLDLIEMNLRQEEAGFSVEKCVYYVDMCGKARGKHVFFRLPMVESFVGSSGDYPLEAPAVRAY